MTERQMIKNPIKLILYFFVPGLAVTVVYTILVHPSFVFQLHQMYALAIATTLMLVPVQLEIILYTSKQTLGRYSIRNMLPYQNKIALKHYLWLVPVLFAWAAIVLVYGRGIENFLKDTVFGFIPDWYILSYSHEALDKLQLFIMFLITFFITGLFIPIVEEVYFRGFLLPRMEYLGIFAPVLNAVLFACYHFWSPWQIPTRIIALIPFCYVAYKTRNIKVVIIVHALLNILGDSLYVLLLLFQN